MSSCYEANMTTSCWKHVLNFTPSRPTKHTHTHRRYISLLLCKPMKPLDPDVQCQQVGWQRPTEDRGQRLTSLCLCPSAAAELPSTGTRPENTSRSDIEPPHTHDMIMTIDGFPSLHFKPEEWMRKRRRTYSPPNIQFARLSNPMTTRMRLHARHLPVKPQLLTDAWPTCLPSKMTWHCLA